MRTSTTDGPGVQSTRWLVETSVLGAKTVRRPSSGRSPDTGPGSLNNPVRLGIVCRWTATWTIRQMINILGDIELRPPLNA